MIPNLGWEGLGHFGWISQALDNLHWGTGVRTLGTVPGARVSWPCRVPGREVTQLSVCPSQAGKGDPAGQAKGTLELHGQVWAAEPQKQQADADIPGIRSGSSSPTAGDGASGSAQPQLPWVWQGADAQPLVHHNLSGSGLTFGEEMLALVFLHPSVTMSILGLAVAGLAGQGQPQ